jgi:hypothetical protein
MSLTPVAGMFLLTMRQSHRPLGESKASCRMVGGNGSSTMGVL